MGLLKDWFGWYDDEFWDKFWDEFWNPFPNLIDDLIDSNRFCLNLEYNLKNMKNVSQIQCPPF